LYENLRVVRSDEIDTISCKMINRRSTNNQAAASNNLNTVQTETQTLNIKTIKQNIIGRCNVDDNTIRS